MTAYEMRISDVSSDVCSSDLAGKKVVHTLLWSNESFFDRNAQILEAFALLRDELDVTVVAYIRRHDSWARSAYMQWGLKHKTYTGRLKSFREWAIGGAPKFAEKLQAFNHLGVSKIILRNLDAVDDSVTDFKNILHNSQLEAPTKTFNERKGS